jgi:hypothetical protein
VEIGFFCIVQKVWDSFQVEEIHNNERKNIVVPTNCNKRKINGTSIMIFLSPLSQQIPTQFDFKRLETENRKLENYIGSMRNLTSFVKMNK